MSLQVFLPHELIRAFSTITLLLSLYAFTLFNFSDQLHYMCANVFCKEPEDEYLSLQRPHGHYSIPLTVS